MIAMPPPVLLSQTSARWRLTEDALIEESGGSIRVYGRWDRIFGCWHQTAEGQMPCAPPGPVLDRRGVWLNPPGERDDDWYASRAAIAAYFSLIPTSIRRLAAPFAEEQWSVLEAVWRDRGVARELDAGLNI